MSVHVYCICLCTCLSRNWYLILTISIDADIELGASTPLMEAAQEGHADLVKFLIEKGNDGLMLSRLLI